MFKKRVTNTSKLYVQHNPKSVISEKFKTIRSNIMFSNATKSVLITSEKPLSGKTTISSNIGITYAQAGYKTLIIDGDMRKPSQHYVFNLSNTAGLSNLIIKKATYEEAIKTTEIEKLHVLTSGVVPPNPSELIGSKRFTEIFKTLEKVYDFIIIDSPPINAVTDAQLFAQVAQNSILIIDVQKNDRDEVKKAKDLLEAAGAKIIGAILNKVSLDKTSHYYYYYGKNEQ
ncbi:polysaccharide biosynthesis tyrosine autokinase [Staphylococcus durrellii]|uniref:polysaccharide biosynthesis tyrosine autokinase n=1 Tax=Staphylococcus durrellii TaxID=2781773 RepID=UPI00189D458C|nr:polysaccharide biosynthesis tyrosine autokinase [Staphylococcus durrellii]MBF7016771.1 polysaccharide biosynthesis tyrosine autokinase [Staphylococcus durrellii]